MKRATVAYKKDFEVLAGDDNSQAAVMVIEPGGAEGGPDNRHRGADQWLFVTGGEGEAIINGKAYPIKAGSIMLIQRGDRHEIKNTGSTPLNTLNIYLPPAYDESGEVLEAGRA